MHYMKMYDRRKPVAGQKAGQRTLRHLKYLHGLSSEAYFEMVKAQSDRCAICRKAQSSYAIGGRHTRTTRLVVDHDHKTGAIRGLLCWSCNIGIGHFKEDVTALRDAAKYLSKAKWKK
jgi:hypothetical protein